MSKRLEIQDQEKICWETSVPPMLTGQLSCNENNGSGEKMRRWGRGLVTCTHIQKLWKLKHGH